MNDHDTTVSMQDRLLKERHALLDLSTRNRLLNVPLRTRNSRLIEIVDEKSAQVLQTLTDGKALSFLPGAQPEPTSADPAGLGPQPGNDTRHTDLKLQTQLTSEALQKRLFDIADDARTLEQEQGVNILYLALGLLRWYDDDASDTPRHAPLVLLPVQLERSSAADRFRLRGRDEPASPNLTLQAKMKSQYGIIISDFPESADNEDALDLNAYAAAIADTVAGHKRWQVLPDAMVLGFFSFAKFLMYRDLDPETWPTADDATEGGMLDHPLITALLRDGFPLSPPLFDDTGRIDDVLPPSQQHHVVDADSSQTVAVAEAVAGRTLVIKGPPGTGKSQTITNIIAGAVAEGKKVLFVAEKMAALDVVHRRLKAAGLGPLTLELHSNKTSKRAVLDELRRTREAAPVAARDDTVITEPLTDVTGQLNTWAARLHAPLDPSGLTPRHILGHLAAWQAAGSPGKTTALTDAGTWTGADLARRRDLAQDIAQRLKALGPVPQNPWRGVGADPLDPATRDTLAHDINAAGLALDRAIAEAETAQRLLGAPTATDLADLDRALAYLQLTPLPQPCDRDALADPAWDNPKFLTDLIARGQYLARLRLDLYPLINEAGRTAHFPAIREQVATKGTNPFRFLDGTYKRHIALLRSYVIGALPKDSEARLKLIDRVTALQIAESAFAGAQRPASAFGRLWQGMDSPWGDLDNLVRWRTSHRLPESVWQRLIALTDAELAQADRARKALYTATTAWRAAFDRVAQTLHLDLDAAFDDSSLDGRLDRLSAWLNDGEGLSRFIAFAQRGRELAALGAPDLVAALHDGTLDADNLVATFDGAYSRVLRDHLFAVWPALNGFDGDAMQRDAARFQTLDRARIEQAKAAIAAAHSEGRPKGAAGIGPLGVLNAELAKKRSHKPIRVLLDQAGPAIQDLKPVFMMSPLSVAQFLKPGGIDFDLLVMDEASQIEPVDALGAVARARQLVVVGDERQLPPTAFFKKLVGEDEAEDDETTIIQARDVESILELCLARGAPHRMLSWHYRSKHPSLIAVSNREFYDNRLMIVPSPHDMTTGMGLVFHHLTDAVYDRGNSRTNPDEARVIAEKVMAHAHATPDQSLGVAAFSVSQRQAILRELERLRRASPQTEAFFAADVPEPFFVKNLENIQGDERDVIFISVGYGKTHDGKLSHFFGPLSQEGGERRLNVLISRAKLRCEIFANFTGDDIDPERTSARGVLGLKQYLAYAAHGDPGADAASADAGGFEDLLAATLRAKGYTVGRSIGASGFRVDLALADPDQPGRYVLGIECDGAQYHEARSARDRDRLRAQVLHDHGWALHRVWSADWYLRPVEELRKIEAAFDAAKNATSRQTQPEPTPNPVVITLALAAPQPAAASRLYEEAVFAAEGSPDDLADDVWRVVDIEGPVHAEEILARLRTLYAVPRLTARFKAALDEGLRLGLDRGLLEQTDDVYAIPGRDVPVRDRSQASAGLRKPERLPPAEIAQAILLTVTENYGAARSDLPPAVARRLGFATTSPALKARIDDGINRLLAAENLIDKDGLIVIPDA